MAVADYGGGGLAAFIGTAHQAQARIHRQSINTHDRQRTLPKVQQGNRSSRDAGYQYPFSVALLA